VAVCVNQVACLSSSGSARIASLWLQAQREGGFSMHLPGSLAHNCICNYATMSLKHMSSVVVCAMPVSLARAGQFAGRALPNAEVRTFADLLRKAPIEPVLVYLTHPDFDHLEGLLKTLKPNPLHVVIYYATKPTPDEAAQLGRLVGEVRPRHTAVFFDANAAAASILRLPHHGRATAAGKSENRLRLLRERFGLTQTEMAGALGMSLRSVQNWEHGNTAAKGHRLRDLEELRSVLDEIVRGPDLPAWLRSENQAFSGRQPLELIVEGKARDILAEFRRLQAGEPM
jgi:transcriptional regulator with XRE-family HTH domain